MYSTAGFQEGSPFDESERESRMIGGTWDYEEGGIHKPEDAEFIAHSREDIPYLLSRLQAAETNAKFWESQAHTNCKAAEDAESRIHSLTEAHMSAVREIHLLHARCQMTIEPLAECGYCRRFLAPPEAHGNED